MADREKVKKELLELNEEAYGMWVHDQKNKFLAQIGNVTDDVLALLKEQEAVEPYQFENIWKCGNCGDGVVAYEELGVSGIEEVKFVYCPTCGRRVLWGGR